MLSVQNISSTSLSEDNKQQGMFQRENDSTEKARADSDSFTVCEDVTQIQILLALRENSVNEDNVVADCDNTEVILNEPLQNELIQDDMKAQITIFEDKPTKSNISEHLSAKRKDNEGIVLNNTQVKKNFDEVVDRFTRALQFPISVKSETQNIPKENVITSDKAHKSKSDLDYNNTTQNSKGQREKSNDSLVSSNTDDKALQCPVDGNVTRHIKNENEIQYFGRPLPSDNFATLINVNDSSDEESSPKRSRQFTFSDSDLPNDDEIREILMMYPKPTFIEPFSESESEISSEDECYRPICRRRRNKPKPVDLKKMMEKLPEKVLTRVRKQPDRLGIEDIKNNSAILKPTYLKEQEDQINENIIIENIKRLKAFRKRKCKSDSTTLKSVKKSGKERSLRKRTVNKSNVHKKMTKVKPKRKNAKPKFKSNARKGAAKKIKNTKGRRRREAVTISEVKTITTRTRSLAKENGRKNIQNRRVLRNRNNKTNSKQKLTNMKVKTRLAKYKEMRSKRQQNAKQKTEDTVKAPISILKKSTHRQSTVDNMSPFSSKSPKDLKRSLVDNSDVPLGHPKRTRYKNTNNNKEIKNNNSRVKKTQNTNLTAFQSKDLLQDKRGPFVYLERYEPTQKQIRMLKSNMNSIRMTPSNRTALKMKTRAQSAPRRSQ